MPKVDKQQTLERLEEGLQSAGIILLVTGAGGALGAVLRESGTGNLLAQHVASLPLSPVLIPFFIATLVRLIQGSGTVAMITAASILRPYRQPAAGHQHAGGGAGGDHGRAVLQLL
ncbi:Gnt-I system [Serratia rubidaea]|uniref:Gnt-I system n=1 Tax=Serratia rubidaea TaxID=61652 RepID=A0A4U9HAX5_SERRU|nr:Gnt-I system [Serratia rubidaea]